MGLSAGCATKQRVITSFSSALYVLSGGMRYLHAPGDQSINAVSTKQHQSCTAGEQQCTVCGAMKRQRRGRYGPCWLT